MKKAHSFTGSQGLCFREFLSYKLFILNVLAGLTVSQSENGGSLFLTHLNLSNLFSYAYTAQKLVNLTFDG